MKILATYDNHTESNVLNQLAKEWSLRRIEFSIRPSRIFFQEQRRKNAEKDVE